MSTTDSVVINQAYYLMVKYDTKRIYEMSFEGIRNFFRDRDTLPKGAEPSNIRPSTPSIVDQNGNRMPVDLRARIRVPQTYITESTQGTIARELANGIIFPYTPSITFERKAEYNAVSAIHSNYVQYFYKNSAVTAISITAKFTVQNDKDAAVYISTKHLLSALTKMPYGTDFGAGSPPPICRLDAYGTYMFKNVPVVITSFRTEFPQDVDYYMGTGKSFSDSELFSLGYQPDEFQNNRRDSDYNFVPTVSTFNISCQPLYSRKEMLESNIDNFLKNYPNNSKYL